MNEGQKLLASIACYPVTTIGEMLYDIETMTRPELAEFMQAVKEAKEKADKYDQLSK